jgi:hypothetical protein
LLRIRLAFSRSTSIKESVKWRFLLGCEVQNPDEIDHGQQEPRDADRNQRSARVEQEFAAKDGKDQGNGEDNGDLQAVDMQSIIAYCEEKVTNDCTTFSDIAM